MGRFAERHHWGRDEGCDTAVAHVRRLAEAGGLWAVVPCEDAHLGVIRHEALAQFGCLVLWGRSAAGDDLDVLLPLAAAKDSARFLSFLESLLTRFTMRWLAYGEGFDVFLVTAQMRLALDAWDGTAAGLARIVADLWGLDGFEFIGTYDWSAMRRLAESSRRPAGP